MELREKLTSYLNDDQIDTVMEAITEGAIKEELLHELLDHPVLDEQYKTNSLIQNVIVPFNMQALDRNIRDRIASGEWQVIGVGEGEDTPPFAYSIGATEKIGGEVMFVGNIDMRSAGSIINQLVNAFIEKGVTDDIGEIGRVQKLDEPLRYKIHHRKIGDYTTDFLVKFPQFYPDYDLDAPLYVIEIGDPENLLPGEPGYDDDLRQFTHIARELEGEVVTFAHDVRSIEGEARSGKTIGLVRLMVDELKEDASKKAILVLNEEKWVDILHYVKNHLDADFEKFMARMDVYEFANFDGRLGDLWEAILKDAGELENGHLYLDNLSTLLYQVNPDTKALYGERREKLGELVAQAAALLPVTFSIHTSSAYKGEVRCDDWFQKNPPCLPEPTQRLKAEVVSEYRYINEGSYPTIELKPISI